MQYVVYFLIAISATTVGAIAGLSGGIIIRPVMDVLGDFNAQTISILSSITVLSMSVVSAGKQIMQKAKINYRIVMPLALGAAIGGICGQRILAAAVSGIEVGGVVTVIQNSVLLVLTVLVFIYMKNRTKIKSRALSGIPLSALVGLGMGMISAFLGIGGGPFNVALMILLFSFDIKTAAICSIVIIFFAQFANVSLFTLTTGFGGIDLSVLPAMVVGAIAGGFFGAVLNKKLSERAVERCYFALLMVVMAITCANIVTHLNLV
ncbi:MAG: sulfite exporter TauE/SafE family protein [Oscillospiraceae bacterium]|nr:sulfite exporter TauE/SafE family protein [Oscillospiraceae bacterium]